MHAHILIMSRRCDARAYHLNYLNCLNLNFITCISEL